MAGDISEAGKDGQYGPAHELAQKWTAGEILPHHRDKRLVELMAAASERAIVDVEREQDEICCAHLGSRPRYCFPSCTMYPFG